MDLSNPTDYNAYEQIMTQTAPSKRRSLRKFYEKDSNLWYFNKDVMGYEHIDNKLHKEMCLKSCEKVKRKMFLVPRGHLKSSCITVGKTCQKILKNPNRRVLIVNAVDANASKFVLQIGQRLKTNGIINALWPDRIPENTNKVRWSGHEIELIRSQPHSEATVECKGVGGALASRHYDILVLDDIVGEKNYKTPELRMMVLEWYQMVIPLLLPWGEIWMLGTRYHYDDLYNHLMNQGKYMVYLRKVIEKGKFIFPQHFDEEYLQAIRDDMKDDFFFFAQYYNDPVDHANATFKKDNIFYYGPEEDHPSPRFPSFFTCVDLALPGKGHDDAVILTCGTDEDEKLYVYRVDYGEFTPMEIIKKIHEHWDQFRQRVIGIETGGYQGALLYNIQDYMKEHKLFWPIHELKPSGRKKDHRIQGLEPRTNPMNPGLFFRREHEDVVRQLLHYPRGKDDIIDTLAYMLDIISPAVPYQGDVEYNKPPVIYSATGYRRYR